MSTFSTIGQDGAYQIYLGGAADGTAPSYGSAVVVKGFMKSGSDQQTGVVEDVSALGDTRVKKRAKRSEGRVEYSFHIKSTGPVTAQSDINCYIKVENKAISGLAAYEMSAGILTSRRLQYEDGANMENLVIDCDADHA